MECGASDLKCQLLLLLTKNGGELSHVLDLVPGMQTWVRDHIQALFGLAGFAFGVWKWWWYREKVLHKRLATYLADQNARLHGARRDVLTLIERPGPGRNFAAPLFAVWPLRRLLKDRGWAGFLPWSSIEQRASRRLEGAQTQINRRMHTATETLKHHRDQLATAHILHGAVAAARAGRQTSPGRQAKLDREALSAFRMALRIPGDGHRLEAREYEAIQLRRLQRWDEARKAFGRLAIVSRDHPDIQQRRLAAARAKRALAEIEQALAVAGSANAVALIEEALAIAGSHLSGRWLTVEKAEMHYVNAYIRNRIGHIVVEDRQLDRSIEEYQRAFREVSRYSWLWKPGERRLRVTALQGLRRAQATRQAQRPTRKYDTAWLYPPSDEPQNPPAAVGDAGSKKSIGEAAKQDGVDDAKKA